MNSCRSLLLGAFVMFGIACGVSTRRQVFSISHLSLASTANDRVERQIVTRYCGRWWYFGSHHLALVDLDSAIQAALRTRGGGPMKDVMVRSEGEQRVVFPLGLGSISKFRNCYVIYGSETTGPAH